MIDQTVLLLTGVPGIGKTTVIKCLAARLTGLPIAGFYTEEIREGKSRVGFRLIGLHGGGFIEDVKQQPGSELWEVNRENRNGMVEEVLAWLERREIHP